MAHKPLTLHLDTEEPETPGGRGIGLLIIVVVVVLATLAGLYIYG